MTRSRLAMTTALLAAACAGAAPPPPAPIGAVRTSLRAVASAQERYWRDHGTYATGVAELMRYPGCRVQPGVTITIHAATAKGWAASGTHPGLADRSCVQWVSEPGGVPVPITQHDGRRGDEEPGGVVCDAEP